MKSHFFAYLSRMRLIKRWSLMRNIETENIAEHSLQVAMIAHALCLISKHQFNTDIDEKELVMMAMYHDTAEVLIGDLPTPVKYFNPKIKESYGYIEDVAKQNLLKMLPDWLAKEYQPLFFADENTKKYRLLKAADKISAYIKCVEESSAGNGEFTKAQKSIRAEIDKYQDLPAVAYFMDNFADSFSKTLDELG